MLVIDDISLAPQNEELASIARTVKKRRAPGWTLSWYIGNFVNVFQMGLRQLNNRSYSKNIGLKVKHTQKKLKLATLIFLMHVHMYKSSRPTYEQWTWRQNRIFKKSRLPLEEIFLLTSLLCLSFFACAPTFVSDPAQLSPQFVSTVYDLQKSSSALSLTSAMLR